MTFFHVVPEHEGHTLRSAEAELVGACVSHRYALEATWDALLAHAAEPDRVTGYFQERDPGLVLKVLTIFYQQGTYDELENEYRVADVLGRVTNLTTLMWRNYLEELWSPRTIDHGYVDALLAQVMEAWRLHDVAVAAYDAFLGHNPFRISLELEDAVYLRLRAAILRRRNERFTKVTAATSTTSKPGPPPSVDWEAIGRLAKR